MQITAWKARVMENRQEQARDACDKNFDFYGNHLGA
jgi:hypothetical protein